MSTNNRAYILCAILAVLCSCHRNDPVSVDFSYNRLSPLMYEFTNLSVGCTSYKWDFGNGTFSTGRDALCVFDEPGKYTVTLFGEVAGERFNHSEEINVTEPDVYITGYTLYAIPYENRYYKLVFKDDALLPSAWDFQTSYTPMLENADLPFTVRFNQPRACDPNKHAYYYVQVMRSTDATSSTDVSCTKQKITQAQLLEYQPEYIIQTESGTCAVGVIMGYDY